MNLCVECGEGIASGDAVLTCARGELCGACATQLYPETMRRLSYSGRYPLLLAEARRYYSDADYRESMPWSEEAN